MSEFTPADADNSGYGARHFTGLKRALILWEIRQEPALAKPSPFLRKGRKGRPPFRTQAEKQEAKRVRQKRWLAKKKQ
jgi:hypothetical protein